MKGPNFWHQSIGLWAGALRPVAAINGALIQRKRAKRRTARLPIPIVTIGVLDNRVGDDVPAMIAIAEQLQQAGLKPVIWVKSQGGPILVNHALHGHSDVGGSALLLSNFCPTVLAQNEQDLGAFIQPLGADIMLAAGDFTKPKVPDSFSVLMVDANRGFGNGLCRPAGPLGLPLQAAIQDVDLVLPIGDGSAQLQFAQNWGSKIAKPIMMGALRPIEMGIQWKDLRVLAFAGADRPDHFFALMRRLGADIVSAHAFAKGEEYTPAVLKRMRYEAQKNNLQIVATEKDALRLPPQFRAQVLSLPLRLNIENWAAFDQCLSAV